MNMRDVKKKRKTKPVNQNKPGQVSEAFTKKELLELYSQLAEVAKLSEIERQVQNIEEKAESTGFHIKVHARMAKTVQGKATLPKHLGRAIMAAETWEERDLLYRRLSAFCYETAKAFLNSGDAKNGYKWMSLTQRFCKLSLDPKGEITEEKLQELEDMLDEIKERHKEEEDKKPKS